MYVWMVDFVDMLLRARGILNQGALVIFTQSRMDVVRADWDTRGWCPGIVPLAVLA